MISKKFNEKDEDVLKSLRDIKYTKHQEGYGFELRFIFDEN